MTHVAGVSGLSSCRVIYTRFCVIPPRTHSRMLQLISSIHEVTTSLVSATSLIFVTATRPVTCYVIFSAASLTKVTPLFYVLLLLQEKRTQDDTAWCKFFYCSIQNSFAGPWAPKTLIMGPRLRSAVSGGPWTLRLGFTVLDGLWIRSEKITGLKILFLHHSHEIWPFIKYNKFFVKCDKFFMKYCKIFIKYDMFFLLNVKDFSLNFTSFSLNMTHFFVKYDKQQNNLLFIDW